MQGCFVINVTLACSSISNHTVLASDNMHVDFCGFNVIPSLVILQRINLLLPWAATPPSQPGTCLWFCITKTGAMKTYLNYWDVQIGGPGYKIGPKVHRRTGLLRWMPGRIREGWNPLMGDLHKGESYLKKSKCAARSTAKPWKLLCPLQIRYLIGPLYLLSPTDRDGDIEGINALVA